MRGDTVMPKQYSIADAKNQLPSLVHRVEQGGAIELTRRGKPVAVLVSSDEYRRLAGNSGDFWSSLQRFRQRADLASLDLVGALAEVRDRSPARKSVPWGAFAS